MAENNLPVWDLSDLYNGINDNQIQTDIDKIKSRAEKFAKDYSGKIPDLTGDELYTAIKEYEEISEMEGKIFSFAGLSSAVNTLDNDIQVFQQNVREKMTAIASNTLFFNLELTKLEDDNLNKKYSESTDLEYYRPVLTDMRVSRPHTLSDDVEHILMEKSVVAGSWKRLFNETMAGFEFDIDGKKLNDAEIGSLMSDPDEEVRKKATLEYSRVLGENISTFTLITNTLAKDKEISDRFRKFKTPVSSQNLNNLVEDEVVESLVKSVKNRYGDISHRYYKLKAKWMGVEKLNLWDRNAPLPDADNTKTEYNDAVELVLSAYNEFSPKLHSVAKKFFDNPWVDVSPRKGKNSGAFAHPCVPSVHPYLLLNYQGKSRDIMTLAHELGHGCHQVLAGSQGYFKSSTPLTIAETASVFGEMLTFKKILNNTTDKNARRVLIAEKVESMINTVFRQISFHEFETLVHENRKKGELSPEMLGDYWVKTGKESLGDAFIYEDFFKVGWSFVPHFIHVPFYVYSYAFGDCLVNSLYSVYENGHDGFEDKYIELLSAGGSMRYNELLSAFGLDATKEDFWDKGLDVISNFVDELEATF